VTHMNRAALISTILDRFAESSGIPRTDPAHIELREQLERASTSVLQLVAADADVAALAGKEGQHAA